MHRHSGCQAHSAAIGSSRGGRRKEQAVISIGLTPTLAADSFATGRFPGAGTFFCLECGSHLSLQEDDRLPECPRCGASSFRRDSIFEPMQEHSGTTTEFPAANEPIPALWLEEARATLQAGTPCLVYNDGDQVRAFSIELGWTRIGRSVAANIRLDDPSVSRRHALVIAETGESLRVLDDRSLNGVFVNGELVEWGELADGDELTIGCYRLFVLEG